MRLRLSKAAAGEVIERCKYLIITANTDLAIMRSICAERGIAPRQARLYLNQAHTDLAATAYPDINLERGKAINRYEYLIKECIRAKQFKTAAQCQEKLDKILGLVADTKHSHEHTGSVGFVWNEERTYETPVNVIDEIIKEQAEAEQSSDALQN